MACTLEKVLGDARTLLERLKEHDNAAEGLIDQSGALSHRVRSMREVGHALPEKVRRCVFLLNANVQFACMIAVCVYCKGTFLRHV